MSQVFNNLMASLSEFGPRNLMLFVSLLVVGKLFIYGDIITDRVALSLQQRSYPRTSLKRPEPAAGGTEEWT